MIKDLHNMLINVGSLFSHKSDSCLIAKCSHGMRGGELNFLVQFCCVLLFSARVTD